MRIGVDFRVVSRHQGGMAVYARSLVDHLRRLDAINDYFLLEDRARENGWGALQKLRWLIGEHYWLQIRFPRLFKQKDLAVGFFPNPPVSFWLRAPVVLTIPDMAFVYDPGLAGWVKAYLFVMYFLSAHKASRILTFSANSRQDITKLLKADPKKIRVTPLAAAETIGVRSSSQVAGDLTKYRISRPFILAVPGTFLPRKNMADLLAAFARLGRQMATSPQLVIVGLPRGGNYQQTVDLANRLGVSDRVRFVGRVADEELSSLYCGASLFVCPSLYEGFGLPILEAMKCGTPVIAYANSSLPEVVGQAGLLVRDSAELALAMTRVLKDSKLQRILRHKGLRRAALYSWDKTAAAFLTSLPPNVD